MCCWHKYPQTQCTFELDFLDQKKKTLMRAPMQVPEQPATNRFQATNSLIFFLDNFFETYPLKFFSLLLN